MFPVLLFIVFLLTEANKGVFSSLDPDLPQHCIRAHNEYRGRHKSPNLIWSTELTEEAQKWANHLASIDQMERDSNTKDGENIFFMYGGDPAEACDRAVENWYSEVRNYDFKSPHESPSTDHFTQIVWKGTKELGVGTAQSKSRNFFLVARYRPSGNTLGAFQDNVDGASDVVPVKVDVAESAPQSSTNTSSVKETSAKQSTPSLATSEAMATKTSTSQDSAGDNLEIPEPAYEDEITSKPEPLVEEDSKQPNGSHGDAERKHGKIHMDKSLAPSDMLMAPPKYGKDYQVEIRFPDIEFTSKMALPSTRDFSNMKLAITSEIMQLYEDIEEFQEVQLLRLRNGSVIATLGLIFSKPGHNYLDNLSQAVLGGKLGGMVVSRDYVRADVVPNGFLKLTLPHQPAPSGQCPQPCSNPTGCFSNGCHVYCCSFQPSSSSMATSPLCPGNCPSTCFPQCTNECCSQHIVAQTVPPVVHMPSTASPAIQYPQCHPSCPVTCIPECTPECCFAPEMLDECSDHCTKFCSTDCPQECCAKKAAIHSQHLGSTALSNYRHLPPLNHDTSTQSAFMYGPKYKALGNPLRQAPKVSRPRITRPNRYTSVPASYWKPYLKLAASYGYGVKDGSLRNTVAQKRKEAYAHLIKTSTQQRRVPYNRQPPRNLQAHGVQNRYGNHPTGRPRIIKDLKSKDASMDVRYAYRYGNRLLVPIDMPKNMDIKELKGRKFISVPAFKRGTVARKEQKRKTL